MPQSIWPVAVRPCENKTLRIAKLLERRIHQGDYALTGIPAERDLAEDLGTSRVTLRKALRELSRKGLLERAPNRRLVLTSKARTATSGLQIAFVSRPLPRVRSRPICNCGWRQLRVSHVSEAIEFVSSTTITGMIRRCPKRFEPTMVSFWVTSSEPIRQWTAELLTEANCIVALSEDLSHLDIPSIVLFPPRLIHVP